MFSNRWITSVSWSISRFYAVTVAVQHPKTLAEVRFTPKLGSRDERYQSPVLSRVRCRRDSGNARLLPCDQEHIKHPSAWASFVFVALLIGLPSYLLHARRVRRERGSD
jgi:hypothetical protein